MPLPISFSLSRFAPRMHKQEGDVLVFQEDALVVTKGKKELHRFPYDEIHRLQYYHFPVVLSRAFQFLSGSLFQRREARFRIEINDQRHEFWLETDLEFRIAELIDLFKGLYRKNNQLVYEKHTSYWRCWFYRFSSSKIVGE